MSASAHHGHLWTLTDGTPVHAPPGRLTQDDDGRIACHLCGRWFHHLGVHLRRHRWTAAAYREAVELPLGEPLCSDRTSERIAARQRQQFADDAGLRERLEPGMELARCGELARRSADSRRMGPRPSPAATARRRARLEAGRVTRRAAADRRIEALVADAGAASLHDLLRRQYDAGASLESLRRTTGMGRTRLRAELDAAGIILRRPGHNTTAAKQRRAVANDAALADRLGVTDVRRWLRARRAEGATLGELAARSGRSVPWVRERLSGQATEGDASQAG